MVMSQRAVYGFLYAVTCIITLWQSVLATRTDLAAYRAASTPVIPALYPVKPPEIQPMLYLTPIQKRSSSPPILRNPRVEQVRAIALNQHELLCLAKNIFHEAGVESYAGKIAVGQVTINRLHSGRWGHSICAVVYKRLQFSWTNSRRLRNETPRGDLWEESKKAARAVMEGERLARLQDALFYHATYIETPDWASPKYVIAQVGQHVFYDSDVKL
jgi:N-acetylmuramoyl-L-alanine amidase